jgi:hypothetical protein
MQVVRLRDMTRQGHHAFSMIALRWICISSRCFANYSSFVHGVRMYSKITQYCRKGQM